MVLFTASNMTSPSAAYHIQIGGTGVDATGNVIGTIVDTTTPELIVQVVQLLGTKKHLLLSIVLELLQC